MGKPVLFLRVFVFTLIYMYYGPPILKVFRIMDLNLKRFLAYYGKIILMPEILMGSNSCKHHTYWGEQDKTKDMDAYPSSSTLSLYIMYDTINKHNVGLQQQMNCEQVPIRYSRR